jgi:hypothetical protein
MSFGANMYRVIVAEITKYANNFLHILMLEYTKRRFPLWEPPLV